jgi:hypothetical protein
MTEVIFLGTNGWHNRQALDIPQNTFSAKDDMRIEV